jgi:hypothetical protein
MHNRFLPPPSLIIPARWEYRKRHQYPILEVFEGQNPRPNSPLLPFGLKLTSAKNKAIE